MADPITSEIPTMDLTAADLWASLWPDGLGAAPTMPTAFSSYATLGLNYIDAGLKVLQRKLVMQAEGAEADDTAHGEGLLQSGHKFLEQAVGLMQKHLEYSIRAAADFTALETEQGANALADATNTFNGLVPEGVTIEAPSGLLTIGTRGALYLRVASAIGMASVPLVPGAGPATAGLVSYLSQQGNKDWDQFLDLAQKRILQAFYDKNTWDTAFDSAAQVKAAALATDTWNGLIPAGITISCPPALQELGKRGAAFLELAKQYSVKQMAGIAGGGQASLPLVQYVSTQGKADWDQFLDLAQKHILQAFFAADELWSLTDGDQQDAAETKATDLWESLFCPLYGSGDGQLDIPDCPSGLLKMGTEGALYQQLAVEFSKTQMPMLAAGVQGGLPFVEQLKTEGEKRWAQFLEMAQKKVAAIFYSRDLWDSVGTEGQDEAKATALEWWNEIQPADSSYIYADADTFPWPGHLLTAAKGELYIDYGMRLSHEQLPINPAEAPQGANYATQLVQRGQSLRNEWRTWAQSKLHQLSMSEFTGYVADSDYDEG